MKWSIIFVIFGLTISNTLVVPEVPEAQTIKHLSVIDTKQITCMAKNIFYEAGHETINGQAAVARVVMNRVNHGFGKNPCQVVYQKTLVNDKLVCQFSWVCEGKGEPNRNSYRYKVAEQIAYEVIVNDGYRDILPRSALFFHNLTVDPLWPHKQVAKIGNHVFYSKAKKIVKPIKPVK